MSKFSLLPFQKDAIDEMKVDFVRLWNNPERQLPLVLKSPTGSGKTFMMAHFINDLNQLPNWDNDKAFLWITFSDDLTMQSRKKFKDYFENTLKNDLLTVEDINNGKLNKNDILFINWQKLVSRSAENRILRRPEDPEMRKESGSYFEDLIDATHDDGREIILVIDEAHKSAGTRLAKEIIDYINPKIIISVSATPENEPSISHVIHNRAGYVEVERERVVEEGLIKEKIVVQSNEDLQKHIDEDLDKVLLDLGFKERIEIKTQFEKMKKNINPLMLIQLPNDDKELRERNEKTKQDIILDYLKTKGVQENHIALWFDRYKKNLEFISENDSDIAFILFKQAAGTGWDCPRAHILVMFREITSPTFYVQTVGRILRMAEPHKKEGYKNSPDLRTGFLFTNYRRNEIAIPDQSNRNKPYVNFSNLKNELKDSVKDFELRSDFIFRVDYGDLAASAKFQASFFQSMNKYFGIAKDDIVEKAEGKLRIQGISLNPKVTNELVVNAEYEDFDQLSFEFKTKGEDLSFEMSQNDVEKTFNYLCYELLKEQTDKEAKITNIARSWSPLKSAIRVWLKSIFGSDSNFYYRVFIYDVLKGAGSKFRPAITHALIDYRPVLRKILEERQKKEEEKEAPIFSIKDKYSFTEDYEEVNQSLCVLDKCFLEKDYSGRDNEIRFIAYIDSKLNHVEWWFKNGDFGKDYYSLKYFNIREQTERLFYPDWLIKFRNGKIGIFDTKAGQTLNTEGRARGLALSLRQLGTDYVGGIVRFANGVFSYCNSLDYNDQVESDNEWIPMEMLFE